MAFQDTLDQLKNFDVGDLDVNDIGVWPAAVKGIILTILFVAVLAGGYFFYLTDKQDLLTGVQGEETTLKSEYESKSFQAANLQQYRDQQTEMEARFGTLLRQLPSDTEVPGLLEDITLAALNNGLKIESIDLQPERRAEFYVELPITVTVNGDFHDLGSFVSGVANLSRIVTLHDFTIAPESSPGDLKMLILAKTYRYLDEGEG
jgi:type IV pilus assembly protein PilO